MQDSPRSFTPGSGLGAYLALLAAYLLFIVYVCFFPDGQAQTGLFSGAHPADTVDDTRRWLDAAINVLLYFPLGLLGVALLRYSRRSGGGGYWLALFGCCLAAAALSTTIEVLQGFGGQRYSDPVDIFSNSLGATLGLLCGHVCFAWTGAHPGALLGFSAAGQSKLAVFAWLRLMGIMLFLLLSALPGDLLTSPTLIFQKLHAEPASIVLNPLTRFTDSTYYYSNLLLLAAYLLPAILNTLAGSRAAAVLLGNVLLGSAVELGQLFLASGHSDIGVLPIALLAAVLVLLLRPGRLQGRIWLLALVVIYLLALAALYWAPYQFEANLDAVRAKWQRANLIPFALHIRHSGLNSVIDPLREALIGLPAGLLMALLWPNRRHMLLLLPPLLLALEWSQLMLPTRFPDITDTLCALAGAWFGWRLAGGLNYTKPDAAGRVSQTQGVR